MKYGIAVIIRKQMLMLHREAYNKIEPKTDHSHYSA